MELKTHLKIDKTVCGEVVELDEGYAKVELETTDAMRADEEGLVHGGFTFGGADFAAMAAVNDPNVVLTKSECEFLAPVRVGEVIVFEATVLESDGRKVKLEVTGDVEQTTVFRGTFFAAILKQHVLSL